MLAINELCFSGKVQNRTENDKGIYFTVYQKVYGKIDTCITVYAPSIAFPDGIAAEQGDTVYVSSALLYQTEDGYIARICHKEQLQIIEKNYDLGEKSAEEEFF